MVPTIFAGDEGKLRKCLWQTCNQTTSNLLVSYQYKKQFNSDIKMECLNPKCHKKKNLNVYGLCPSCFDMCESLKHLADEPEVVTDYLDELRCILDKMKNNKSVDYNTMMTALFGGTFELVRRNPKV